jgi:nitrogen fixation/metabolism regulation signal transduction histidine kinase
MPNAKRRLRNYLLDARFQLKLTGYIIAIALAVSFTIGLFLWGTSRKLMREAELAVEARSRAAETSKDLSNATLSNELLARFDDPAFEQQLREKAAAIDAEYEVERQAILAQRAELVRRQRLVWLTLVGCLAAFVLFIAMATIVVTHRVVGPLFRIRRLANQVRDGRLGMPANALRRGDELKEVFEDLTQMVQSIRTWEAEDLRAIERVIEVAQSGERQALVAELQAVQARMKSRLDAT